MKKSDIVVGGVYANGKTLADAQRNLHVALWELLDVAGVTAFCERILRWLMKVMK